MFLYFYILGMYCIRIDIIILFIQSSCSGRVNTRNICYPNKRSIYHLLLLIVYNITKIQKKEDVICQNQKTITLGKKRTFLLK